jgi:hypothetical protein
MKKLKVIQKEEVSRETEDFLEIELLAGYEKDEVFHKTVLLREITGTDEEAISKPELKQNPSKLITTLLSRCIQKIGTLERKDFTPSDWKEIITDLYVGDQDFALLKLRELSLGEEIEVAHVCPSCKSELNTFIGISELDIIPYSGISKIPFELIRGYTDKKGVLHKKGYIRLPKGRDREILAPIAKKNIAQASTLMLTRLCTFDTDLYVTEDVMRDLKIRDREYLQKEIKENLFGIDLDIEVTCTSCGERFKGSLNPVNFI